jgi:hypothetical protein
MLTPGELVIPKPLVDEMRGQGGSRRGDVNVHVTIHALDGRGVEDVVSSERFLSAVARAASDDRYGFGTKIRRTVTR